VARACAIFGPWNFDAKIGSPAAFLGTNPNDNDGEPLPDWRGRWLPSPERRARERFIAQGKIGAYC
jgi:hypothetical protein